MKKIKNRLKLNFFEFLNHLTKMNETQFLFSKLQRFLDPFCENPEFKNLKTNYLPYENLGKSEFSKKTCFRDDIIFITGRFRSGSTLLWNIFRNIPSVTAYYEPFNERRWFDKSTRGKRVDSSHQNVSEYWSEYNNLSFLSEFYKEEWIRQQLFMSSFFYNPLMQRYIEILVEKSKGRPCLQFNRIDFRLPWIRNCFPNSKILHIYRHPRDQWCSTLMHNNKKFSTKMTLHDFEQFDGFYLLTWARDLIHFFPFLSLDKKSNPYELFYQIWRLSFLFGDKYSDFSIAFENILDNPKESIFDILSAVSLQNFYSPELLSLVMPISRNKWKNIASNEWFSSIEAKVDDCIQNYFFRYSQTYS
jgi:hypothetical protein